MSATYEGMSPGGHETYATSIFSKIKAYLDSNPYGYLTTHQDISGKADKSATVSTVTWSNNKLTKTINGTTSDVVSAATILGNLTSSQVTTALGYVPGPSYIFESSDGSINISDSMVPGRETIDLTVNGKVSTEGDTISGDYVNTADFSEGGVYGKRVTTYGSWGIDVEEYLADSLWSRLSLRDSDILLTKTWDGTNTSLKSSITSLRNDKVNLGDLTWNNISGKPSTFAPSAHDHNYLVSAGKNTQSTSSTAFATGAFNVRWFTETGKIPGQPSQYGFLLTTATGTNSGENHQIFMAQANGDLFHRGTNSSSSSNPPAFKKILDSSNYTSYTRNSSGVIKVKSVNKTPTNAGTSLASPTPSIDTGYKFLCWLYVQSNGYIVGASYPGGATATNATWWFANGYLANHALTFYYLEIKDTI